MIRVPVGTPRRIALAVVLVLIAGTGWRLARAPAPQPQASPSATDRDGVDPRAPASAGLRSAASASAIAGGEPRATVRLAAATAPDKAADSEQCGLDDGPQFSTPTTDGEMPVQTRAATQSYQGAQARIDAALRASADPLDHAVADLLNVGDMRSEPGVNEAVVQQAVDSTDGRLYALGYGLRHSIRAPAPSCGRISAARWTQIDPGNGTPWLYALAQAQAASDAAGVRAAMSQLAAAARFDTYFSTASGAVARQAFQGGVDLAPAGDLVVNAIGVEAVLSSPPYQPLTQVCRNHAGGDETIERQCRAVSDTMLDHSDTLMGMLISGAVIKVMTGDESRRERAHAEQARLMAAIPASTDQVSCRYIRDVLTLQRRSAQVGEVEALRERARQSAKP